MRVANADSDWDIHCFYLPRDPAVRAAASLFTGVAAMACEWGRDVLDDDACDMRQRANNNTGAGGLVRGGRKA